MEIRDCADCRPRPAVMSPPPVPALYGPWFTAAYDGHCAMCGSEILDGDEIRSDGQGGWLARCCGDDDEPLPAYMPGTGHAATLLEQFAAGHIDLGRGIR